VKYIVRQSVRLHGPMTVQGPEGQVSMTAEESVPGRIVAAYLNGTYDVQTVEPIVGTNYFPSVREDRLSPA
jgi:hypothetical protein